MLEIIGWSLVSFLILFVSGIVMGLLAWILNVGLNYLLRRATILIKCLGLSLIALVGVIFVSPELIVQALIFTLATVMHIVISCVCIHDEEKE